MPPIQENPPPQGQGKLAVRNAWLQMLRPPNLFTVPGDPIVGYLLVLAAGGLSAESAQATAVVLAALASLLLYACGLLQNDYFDLAEDRRERPDRPLPSGRLKPGAVIAVAFAMGVWGIVIATWASPASGAVAAILLVAVTIYNAGGKRIRFLGSILMGVCRALSFLLGAAVLGYEAMLAPAVIVSAAGLLLFIAAVTQIASRETQTVRVGLVRFAPAAIVAAWLGWMLMNLQNAQATMAFARPAVVAFWAVLWMVYCGHLLKGSPAPAMVQKTIGLFIGGLLFVQAALAMHLQPQGAWVAAALLICWPISRRVAMWFYAS